MRKYRRLSWEEVCDVRKRHREGETIDSLATAYGVRRETVDNIVRFKTRIDEW